MLLLKSSVHWRFRVGRAHAQSSSFMLPNDERYAFGLSAALYICIVVTAVCARLLARGLICSTRHSAQRGNFEPMRRSRGLMFNSTAQNGKWGCCRGSFSPLPPGFSFEVRHPAVREQYGRCGKKRRVETRCSLANTVSTAGALCGDLCPPDSRKYSTILLPVCARQLLVSVTLLKSGYPAVLRRIRSAVFRLHVSVYSSSRAAHGANRTRLRDDSSCSGHLR